MKIAIAIITLAVIAAVMPTTDCQGKTKDECNYITQVNAGMID